MADDLAPDVLAKKFLALATGRHEQETLSVPIGRLRILCNAALGNPAPAAARRVDVSKLPGVKPVKNPTGEMLRLLEDGPVSLGDLSAALGHPNIGITKRLMQTLVNKNLVEFNDKTLEVKKKTCNIQGKA